MREKRVRRQFAVWTQAALTVLTGEAVGIFAYVYAMDTERFLHGYYMVPEMLEWLSAGVLFFVMLQTAWAYVSRGTRTY